jgi:hypothetical protein
MGETSILGAFELFPKPLSIEKQPEKWYYIGII